MNITAQSKMRSTYQLDEGEAQEHQKSINAVESAFRKNIQRNPAFLEKQAVKVRGKSMREVNSTKKNRKENLHIKKNGSQLDHSDMTVSPQP